MNRITIAVAATVCVAASVPAASARESEALYAYIFYRQVGAAEEHVDVTPISRATPAQARALFQRARTEAAQRQLSVKEVSVTRPGVCLTIISVPNRVRFVGFQKSAAETETELRSRDQNDQPYTIKAPTTCL